MIKYPRRQLSFNDPNSNHQLHSPRPNKLTSARINHSAKLIKQKNEQASNLLGKKRSKTQEDIKSNLNKQTNPKSPSIHNKPSANQNQKSIMSHILTNVKKSHKSPTKSTINQNEYNKSPSKQIRSSKSITITAVTTTSSDEAGDFHLTDKLVIDESSSVLLNLSSHKQSILEQQIELQNKIQKQRQEKRLVREKI